MSTLMDSIEYVRAYLDDLLVITKGSFEDHLLKLKVVLERLQNAGLRVNLPKSGFCTQELKYLDYWLTPTGIRPLTKKVEAILRLQPPKTLRQLRSFLGMVNYYRDMWKRRSHILTPLTAMLQKKSARKYQWTKEADEAFQQIKKVISDQVMLTFPKFGEPFDIYTDASDCQLGAVISQNGKPIAFYSRKLTPTQKRYTVGEREALSIVETLKEFKNILLGQDITVHTDHMNLVNPTTHHESSRVIRWRWLIEEFGPKFEYVKGHKNVVADALSRMDADHLESYNLPDGDEDIEETIQT
jgi:hypothetical protein